ncbi:MAG: sulfate adenylyltransferase, partial [Alphaproteobacteria bacterium]|nr:sulfate adenylyltransferase [Alphaproteobacteria bacterium]
ERIPLAQKYIIRTAKELGRKVYVATNLLETMVVAPTPTRAEVNDIFNTLQDGADGLVLAAETAVGKYPINCAAMIVKLVREFRSGVPDVPSSEAFSLLPEPHGGRLRIAMADEKERREAEQLPRMTLPDAVLRDAEQMALGLFSPVDGFMDREALESVLDRCRLPDGTVWPIPLVMPSPTSAPPAKGRRVALCSEAGVIHSVLDVGDVFEVDLDDMARRWDGFAPRSFPSATLIAGKVRLIERLPSPYRAHELTPEQTRFIFTQKGWTRVVAFQSRNVPHRAHEHIQSKAMERTHADGLFINPLTGPCRPGDVLPGTVIRGYETLLDFGAYPPGRAIVGCLSARPRGLGPREAVFTALCLKNMGCSHVIIGQSHSGDGVRELFGSLGDIGIEPVFFESLGWDPAGGTFVGQTTNPDASPLLSADVRRALAEGRPLPDWTIRSILQETLRAELSAGRPLFCGGG